MAFKLIGDAVGYEFRRFKRDRSKAGKEFVALTFESCEDGSTLEVSTTDPDLMDFAGRMQRACVYNVPVIAIAGRERSYIILRGQPVYVGTAE